MPESEKDPILTDIERKHVDDALESILATEKFDAAPQMSAFLRYVVEQAADGNQSRIKAFTVAVDALGKPETFDPQNDPVVRVLAGRLRAALASYNEENVDAPLVITMKPGSYVPTFLRNGSIAETHTDLDQTLDATGEPDLSSDLGIAVSATEEDEVGDSSMSNRDTLPATPATEVELFEASIDNIPYNDTKSAGLFGSLAHMFTRAPKLVLAGVLVASLLIALIQNKGILFDEPDMQAAVPANATDATSGVISGLVRPRPDELSLFISAVDKGNARENSLNAIISSMISETANVKVYRILDSERETVFWPEDYILSLTALDLPGETRVNMQLMEAVTGRVVHSQVVRLNELAFENLTEEELAMLVDSALSIVSEDGPLVSDYSSRKVSRR